MITRVKSISSLVRFVAIFPLFLAPWLQRALAQGDVTPPTLLSVSVSPNPVDAQQSPQTVTIQLGASDNLSGVDFEEPQFIYDAVTFTSPSGNETINVRGATFSLVSGNTMNGVWQSTFTVSNYSESGAWTLTEVTFPDAVGNFQAYNATQLAALGLATTLTVESTPDTTPPQLTGLTLTPASVNVSAGPQTITATFRSETVAFGSGNYTHGRIDSGHHSPAAYRTNAHPRLSQRIGRPADNYSDLHVDGYLFGGFFPHRGH